MQVTRFANGQQVHCPVCAKHLWIEAVVWDSGFVATRLTDASLAHLKGHAAGTSCTCIEVPERDEFVAIDGPCTVHHGYHCPTCSMVWAGANPPPHTHIYVRKVTL